MMIFTQIPRDIFYLFFEFMSFPRIRFFLIAFFTTQKFDKKNPFHRFLKKLYKKRDPEASIQRFVNFSGVDPRLRLDDSQRFIQFTGDDEYEGPIELNFYLSDVGFLYRYSYYWIADSDDWITMMADPLTFSFFADEMIYQEEDNQCDARILTNIVEYNPAMLEELKIDRPVFLSLFIKAIFFKDLTKLRNRKFGYHRRSNDLLHRYLLKEEIATLLFEQLEENGSKLFEFVPDLEDLVGRKIFTKFKQIQQILDED